MRGISPIVSTILMVAIAIAAAVVVYYITMGVVTQQGAQVQEEATSLSQGSIRIVAATLEVNGDSDFNTIGTSDEDKLEIYYTLLNTEKNTLTSEDKVVVYIYDTSDSIVCKIDDNLDLATSGVIKLKDETVTTCTANIEVNKDYYLQVTAAKIAPSNKYKVMAQPA